MTREVRILGAGGLGRELFHWARACGLSPVGFIDDNPAALSGFDAYPPVCGGVAEAPVDLPILCGIGQNPIRVRCVDSLKARGATFASCVHPRAVVLPGSVLGEGTVVAPFAYVACNATVGAFAFLQAGSVVGHDVLAGDFLRMDTGAFVGGFAVLGDRVTVYTGAKVMPGKRMGDDSVLGAGSALMSNLPAGRTAFGLPAVRC